MTDPATRLLEIQSVQSAIKITANLLLREIETFAVDTEPRRDRVILFRDLTRNAETLQLEAKAIRLKLINEASSASKQSPLVEPTLEELKHLAEEADMPADPKGPTEGEVRRRRLLEKVVGAQRAAALHALLTPHYRR